MNPVLFNLALKLSDFRDKFGWTQDELAKRSGISRATIINVEKDPGRLTKTMALAILFVFLAELTQREQILQDKKLLATKPLSDWAPILGLTSKSLLSTLPFFGIASLGAFICNGAVGLAKSNSKQASFFSSISSLSESNPKYSTSDNEDERLTEFQQHASEAIKQLRLDMEQKLEVPLTDLWSIIKAIDDAEPQKNS